MLITQKNTGTLTHDKIDDNDMQRQNAILHAKSNHRILWKR